MHEKRGRKPKEGCRPGLLAGAGQKTVHSGSVGACEAVGWAGRGVLDCRGGRLASVARMSTGRIRAAHPVLGASQARGLGGKREERSGLGTGVNIRLGSLDAR